jgi:hypothetical protein
LGAHSGARSSRETRAHRIDAREQRVVAHQRGQIRDRYEIRELSTKNLASLLETITSLFPGNIQFNFPSDETENTEMEIDETLNTNSVTYFAINDVQSEFGRYFAIGR